MVKRKCECPENSMDNPNPEWMYEKDEKIGMYHEPHKCKCTANLRLYRRGKKKLWLCSCCYYGTDIPIDE